MVSLSGPTSKEILHYLDVHLTNSSAESSYCMSDQMICWKITVNQKQKTLGET